MLVFDVHSYNYQRPGMGDVPLFNIGKNFRDTLVLSTGHKKVFVDEYSGESYSNVFEKLHAEFEQAISENTKGRASPLT